jgi:hypothetical protein
MDSKIRAAIASILQDCWKPIRYLPVPWDGQLSCWVSDAQALEVRYTAFTFCKRQGDHRPALTCPLPVVFGEGG